MRSAPCAVYWDEDLATARVTWSEALASLADGPVPDGADRTWWAECVHEDDRVALAAALDRLRTGRDTHWSGAYRVRSGARYRTVREQIVLVEQHGKPRRLVGTIRDGRPAPKLPDEERRFATFVDQLPLLAWETDADGWIDFYNQRWFDYTGTTMAEMEGWGWVRVHDPDDLPRMLRVFRDALESGRPWEDAFRIRRGSDGMLRWHLSRAFPLRDATGRIVRWFGTNTDIHEQRLALEERETLLKAEQRLRAEAEAANREKDEFLAVVSHELRTPLSVVLLWSQLLSERPGDQEWTTRGLGKIQHNAKQLGRLIEDLLDTSRIISGKLEIERQSVEMALPARRAIEALTSDAAARRVDVQLDVPAEPAFVVGSSPRLEQIVTNLVANAIRFSHEGGVVRVRVARDGDVVRLDVQDEGEGIEPALLPHLFERFRQGDSSTRRQRGGLGLGLSIVRHLAVLHGGGVEAESAGPGHGATFRVRLPRAGGASLESAEPAPECLEARASLAGVHVLGIDDDVDAREVLTIVLASCQATVTVAGSVGQALELLRADRPDVVVSDLAMPEVDGYGLLDQLRASPDERLRTIPVVALTAHASAQDRSRALRAGFDAYVAKPFDAATLSRAIARVVRERTVPWPALGRGGGTS